MKKRSIWISRCSMDNLSPENRRKNMSHIRSQGNRSTENRLRSSLAGAGISGYQMHVKSLPGKPDFAFPSEKVAVFVDGCFWHGCPVCYMRPKSSQDYWDNKLRGNKDRDVRVDSELEVAGWVSLRIWEHCMKRPQDARRIIADTLEQRRVRDN